MKITGIETLVVNADVRNWVFVKVLTSAPGLYGWGEASVEFRTKAVLGCLEDLAPLVVGEDPRRIANITRKLAVDSFWPLGVVGFAAAGAIEQALWDIKGKDLGVPVYQLLGGAVRDRIKVYTHIFRGDAAAQRSATSPRQIIEGTLQTLEFGYAAIKLGIFPPVHHTPSRRELDALARTAQDLRDAVGDGVDLMFDIHGRSESVSAAIGLVEAVATAGPIFVEEPIQPGDNAAMRRISDAASVPLATGERLFTGKEFFDLARHAAVAVAQPDPCRVGGIGNLLKIAGTCEAAGMAVAPHNPLGPVCGAVCQHLDAVLPNAVIQEEARGVVGWYDEIATHEMELADGFWPLPTRPGLGVEIDEQAAARHPYRPENPERSLRHADGTLLYW